MVCTSQLNSESLALGRRKGVVKPAWTSFGLRLRLSVGLTVSLDFELWFGRGLLDRNQPRARALCLAYQHYN